MGAHPLYLKVEEGKRWRVAITAQAVYAAVTSAARQKPATPTAMKKDEGWHWRLREDGLGIGARRVDVQGARYELRIWRTPVPGWMSSEEEFEGDVADLLRVLSIEATRGDRPSPGPEAFWVMAPNAPRDEGKYVVRLLSLLHGESRPGKSQCFTCAEAGTAREIDWFANGGVQGQRCFDCAHGRTPAGRALYATTPGRPS